MAATVVAFLACTAFWMLFSRFPGYDDEGYILLTAREYFRHGHLYDRIYSQYGPALYVLTDALQAVVGLPVDHILARWLTLGLWVGTAAACGGLVLRTTSSLGLAVGTAAATFLYLHFVPDEPFHPGSYIILLLAVAGHLVPPLLSRPHPAASLGLGVIAAFLLLTKVNVGVLFILSLAGWFSAHSLRWTRPAMPGIFVAAGLSACAAMLMRTLLWDGWVATYLALFAGAALPLMLSSQPSGTVPRAVAGWFAIGLTAAALGVVSAVMARGTTPHGLIDGMLLEPLRHAASYSFAVDWRPGTLAWAALSLALFVVHHFMRVRVSERAADRLVVALRVGLGVMLLVAILLVLKARVIGTVFSFFAPSLWIWVVRLSGASLPSDKHLLRSFIAIVLLLQFLQAFPVGGIQEAWGTFLLLPLVGMGLGEVQAWWARERSAALDVGSWKSCAAIAAVLLMAKLAWVGAEARAEYGSRRAFDVPGAAGLRLPEAQRTANRILSLNATVHADVLFSCPGMFSFNLWADCPTPTQRNTTVWFTLLDHQEQRDIIASLEKSPRACVIVDERLLALTQSIGTPVTGPLHDFIRTEFAPAFRVESFAFLARKGRTLAPLNLVLLHPRADNPTQSEITFYYVGENVPISALEATAVASPSTPSTRYDATNTTVTLTRVDSAGRPAAAPVQAQWPLTFSGPTLVRMATRTSTALETAEFFYLYSSDGERVGDLRRVQN